MSAKLKKGQSGLVKAGDIGLVRSLALPFTAAQAKLLDAAADIQQNPDDAEAAYMARQLVQCTLPHSDPGDVPAWGRTNMGLSLGISPGWNFAKNKSVGIPYGTVPRLLLFWATTEAVRTKNRRLELGSTLSGFMRELGLDPSHGGKRSDARRLKEQTVRLFSASISFQQTARSVEGNEGIAWLNMPVTDRGELWWSPRNPDQAALWGSWIELGERFYQAVTSAPVPLDTRALRALKRSPLALDLYSLITYRAFVANKKRAPQTLAWRDLEQQLGADYADSKDFRKKLTATLRKVLAVLPAVKLAKQRSGLTILPGSLPAITPKS